MIIRLGTGRMKADIWRDTKSEWAYSTVGSCHNALPHLSFDASKGTGKTCGGTEPVSSGSAVLVSQRSRASQNRSHSPAWVSALPVAVGWEGVRHAPRVGKDPPYEALKAYAGPSPTIGRSAKSIIHPDARCASSGA
ncbi:hypothetical protein C8Q74DRAFT_848567 [Fomes fomentarius]|nr:hypothetical protein C8Q74DRAFT_848567 [Fomes fomentarius]